MTEGATQHLQKVLDIVRHMTQSKTRSKKKVRDYAAEMQAIELHTSQAMMVTSFAAMQIQTLSDMVYNPKLFRVSEVAPVNPDEAVDVNKQYLVATLDENAKPLEFSVRTLNTEGQFVGLEDIENEKVAWMYMPVVQLPEENPEPATEQTEEVA